MSHDGFTQRLRYGDFSVNGMIKLDKDDDSEVTGKVPKINLNQRNS